MPNVSRMAALRTEPSRNLRRLLSACCLVVLVCLVPSQLRGQMGGSNPFGGGPGRTNFPNPDAERQKVRNRVPRYGPVEKVPIAKVAVEGTQHAQVAWSQLDTREGGIYDPDTIQNDVRKLYRTGRFQQVDVFKDDLPDGKSITFRLTDRDLIRYVRYIGNEKINDKKLSEELGLKAGDPMNRFAVEEAARRLQSMYLEKGYGDSHIEILEGRNQGDEGVVFQIHEGEVQRIFSVDFVGNKIATDARLKTQVLSKPGMVSDLSARLLWRFGKTAQADLIEQDVERLTGYYRSLGFFRARIGKEITYSDDRTKAYLKFVIDEGVRYKIRDIVFEGNTRFSSPQLMQRLESGQGQYFNLAQLQRDLSGLRDAYGSLGYIFADIRGEPRFQETPGALDIVYKIDEGQQYRVGKIFVNIEGDTSHTRRTAVLNRLSIKPGDIVDLRQIRSSERRLKSSQLFETNPAVGSTPRISVRPSEDDDLRYAERSGMTTRGQSPQRKCFKPLLLDLVIRGVAKSSGEVVQPTTAKESRR